MIELVEQQKPPLHEAWLNQLVHKAESSRKQQRKKMHQQARNLEIFLLGFSRTNREGSRIEPEGKVTPDREVKSVATPAD